VLALILGGTAYYLFTDDRFIIRSIQIGGLRYVPAEEVFNETGIAGQSILMVDPEAVVERLELMPSLDSAEVVQVEWPAQIVIQVREREPALMWEQDDNRYWVDLNGHLMVVRRDLPNLLRVVNEGEAIPFQCPGPRCAEQDEITIDPDIVRGAQHLKTLRGNIDVLYYDPVRGLSYLDGRGWRGYFGVGTDMDRKLIIYETLVANLESRGLRPLYIDVSHPDAPYYRLAE
jgi:cell division septal protein FtsQ